MSTCRHVHIIQVSCLLVKSWRPRRISVFGHIAQLESDVPLHMMLRRHIDLSVGRRPGPNWRRHPGRPGARWRRRRPGRPGARWRRRHPGRPGARWRRRHPGRPGARWRRRHPGRPGARWIDEIRRDSSSSPVELWRCAIRHGHAVGAMQRPLPATRR